jgi:hypothetical protein
MEDEESKEIGLYSQLALDQDIEGVSILGYRLMFDIANVPKDISYSYGARSWAGARLRYRSLLRISADSSATQRLMPIAT